MAFAAIDSIQFGMEEEENALISLENDSFVHLTNTPQRRQLLGNQNVSAFFIFISQNPNITPATKQQQMLAVCNSCCELGFLSCINSDEKNKYKQ